MGDPARFSVDLLTQDAETADGAAVEVAPGLYAVRVCDPDTSAAFIARAERAAWNGATINADRSIDRAVRDAEVVDEAAHRDLVDAARDMLYAATRDLAAELAPGTVLAEVQIVRYFAGGLYIDHRDTPALGATPRALSLVWYLNDQFSGGETRFVGPDVIMTPLAGVAIAFSPLLMHRAEPVLAGTKYVVTAWYHEVPRELRT